MITIIILQPYEADALRPAIPTQSTFVLLLFASHSSHWAITMGSNCSALMGNKREVRFPNGVTVGHTSAYGSSQSKCEIELCTR